MPPSKTRPIASFPSAYVVMFMFVGTMTSCHQEFPRADEEFVCTSTPVLAAIVQQVAGSEIRVASLLGPGQSPHGFEPLPSAARIASRAQLVIFAAEELDGWITDLTESPHVELIALVPDSIYSSDQAESRDSHFWTDPLAVRAILSPIAQRLCSTFRGRCDDFESNAQAFADSLHRLHLEIEQRLRPLRGATFLVSHPFLNSFMKRYGLEMSGVIGTGEALEPSAGDIARQIVRSRRHAVAAILVEQQESTKPAMAVAESIRAPLIPLDFLGVGSDRWTYADLLRRNARRLQEVVG